ncbi:hypothetical protein PsorP6_008508 [Peronosclerospora sorghi]|uniref:Uncharacterized protein n=1 Tax=Peronosclerospora sorghi TaxID=230839 RepID=A0ACC0WC32_9STRA|nr:hypothetical protein PsorP6_008508 [Peronosclerospora sorghi]
MHAPDSAREQRKCMGSLKKKEKRRKLDVMGNSTSKKTNRRHSAATRELEKLSGPSGLYPSCPWGLKAARRLILERKLAPRYHGKDVKEGDFKLECPICFMKNSLLVLFTCIAVAFMTHPVLPREHKHVFLL